MTGVLSSWHCDGATVEHARKTAAEVLGPGAVAFATSPASFDVWTWRDGEWRTAPGRHAALDGVYELRAFGRPGTGGVAGEVRWLHEHDGDGRLAVVRPGSHDTPSGSDWHATSRQVVGALGPRRYLLWGEVHAVRDGWATLAEARVAPVAIPIDADVAEGTRLQLVATEYLARDDHGNTFVLDELLNGFDVPAEGGDR